MCIYSYILHVLLLCLCMYMLTLVSNWFYRFDLIFCLVKSFPAHNMADGLYSGNLISVHSLDYHNLHSF